MFPKIGIIIINYQDYARRFLADCRDSLRALDYPKDRYSVYIIDNATSLETLTHLKASCPEAIVIPEPTNAGWGGGNNIGALRALADGCDDVVFANMDVIVHHDWLKELVTAAYSDPTIGIVQSKLLIHPAGADGIQRVNSLGNQFHFLGFGFCEGYGQPDQDTSDNKIHDIPYASGASLYVKGEVFRRVGYCSAEFFMYHDDIELCLKARLLGHRIVIAPASIMQHKYEFYRSARLVYYMERNRLLVILEFYKIPTLILLAPAFVLMELAVLAGGFFGGYAGAKLRSWAYFFQPHHLLRLWRERKKIQKTRRLSDRDFFRFATGTIRFQEIANPILVYLLNPIFNFYWQVTRRCIFW